MNAHTYIMCHLGHRVAEDIITDFLQGDPMPKPKKIKYPTRLTKKELVKMVNVAQAADYQTLLQNNQLVGEIADVRELALKTNNRLKDELATAAQENQVLKATLDDADANFVTANDNTTRATEALKAAGDHAEHMKEKWRKATIERVEASSRAAENSARHRALEDLVVRLVRGGSEQTVIRNEPMAPELCPRCKQSPLEQVHGGGLRCRSCQVDFKRAGS